jgi:hypothetical protein
MESHTNGTPSQEQTEPATKIIQVGHLLSYLQRVKDG